jgi:HEAT repeat protein
MAKTLLSDPDEGIRRRAARYLGDLGGPAATAALQQAARSGSLSVQVASAASLNKLGDPGPAQAMLPQIAPMLENPDGAFREDAVAYLDALRSPYSLPLLSQALRDSNSNVRKDAIDALVHLAVPQSIPLIEQALADPNPEVARNAAKGLEKLRNPAPTKSK